MTEAFWYWLKLGLISFGDPAGQIALMHIELVERRRWVSERCFLHALNYCMVLPGSEATQLAVYPVICADGRPALGLIGGRVIPDKFQIGGSHAATQVSYGPAIIDDDTPPPAHARFAWCKLVEGHCHRVSHWLALPPSLATHRHSYS